MMTFIYKEPLQLLTATLDNIKAMAGSEDFIVIVGFEERSPDKENKLKTLEKMYSNAFSQLLITVHPFGVEGEIPGKCSNVNFA